MISGLKIKSLAAAATVLLALVVLAPPARAAEPTFPTGSRIGLVPPAGMVTNKGFPGFEDPDKHAAIVVTAMPPAAYAELDKTAVPDVLKTQGITMAKREPLTLSAGKAFVVTGTAMADNMRYRKWLMVAAVDDMTAFVSVQVPESDTTYTDDVVRAALATVTVRASVPDAEELSLLPFKVGDLAGFKIEGVLPGRALMLVDLPAEQKPDADDHIRTLDGRMFLTTQQGGPSDFSDQDNFARTLFDGIGGIKDVRLTMSEPLNMNGQEGYQTMAQAKEAQGDTKLMVVQWLRFGGGGYLQMVGIARADIWTSVLARMRTVRDSIDTN
jgi:hypothetical protein